MNRRDGFTLIELLVVIAIISLLVSILMPSLQKAKQMAKDIVCSSNQKSIAIALAFYGEDYDDQIPFTTARNFWFLSWAKRVGKINDIPGAEPMTLPPPNEWNDPDGILYKISTTGYIDYKWSNWLEGPIKCSTYWDQVHPKCPPPIHPECQGRQFSMNGMLTPETIGMGTIDHRKATCTRYSDLKTSPVLIGDCSISPLPIGTMPSFRYVWGRTKDEYSEWDLADRGPWPWVDFYTTNHPSWTRHPADFYGHTGEKSNLAFVDGHVEAIREIKPIDFSIH